MTLTLLAVAMLATWQIVEIWHHSALFAGWRAEVELWDGRLGEALRCPFCLSVWVALIVSAALCWWQAYDLWWIYALAVSRSSNLANDYFHSSNRTPKSGRIPELPDNSPPYQEWPNDDEDNQEESSR